MIHCVFIITQYNGSRILTNQFGGWTKSEFIFREYMKLAIWDRFGNDPNHQIAIYSCADSKQLKSLCDKNRIPYDKFYKDNKLMLVSDRRNTRYAVTKRSSLRHIINNQFGREQSAIFHSKYDILDTVEITAMNLTMFMRRYSRNEEFCDDMKNMTKIILKNLELDRIDMILHAIMIAYEFIYEVK